MFAQFGVANIIRELLEKLVLKPAAVAARGDAVKFVPHAGCQALVDDVVSPVPNDTGSAAIFGISPRLSR